jgi:hypothetical protein
MQPDKKKPAVPDFFCLAILACRLPYRVHFCQNMKDHAIFHASAIFAAGRSDCREKQPNHRSDHQESLQSMNSGSIFLSPLTTVC